MNIYNPFYTDADHNNVDFEFDHPVFGRIPTSLKIDGSDADTESRERLCEMLKEADIKPYTPQVVSDEHLIEVAKTQRDLLLSETDWYLIRQVETGEAVPANVLNYRQALRDITKQPGYPNTIEWPVLDA